MARVNPRLAKYLIAVSVSFVRLLGPLQHVKV